MRATVTKAGRTMYNDEIFLVDIVNTVNNNGTVTETETRTRVNARVESVKRNEFYMAKSAGFNPEVVFVISNYRDYNHQRYADWNGRRFVVARTYRAVDETALEIVCEGVTEDGAV